MRRAWLGAVLLAACSGRGFALDLDVEPGCLLPTQLTVVASAPSLAPQTQSVDGASFFAGRHHVVVLLPDGISEVTVAVTAFDGTLPIASNSVTVPISGPAEVARSMVLDGGCMGDGAVGDSAVDGGAPADLFAGDGSVPDDLAYLPSCAGARCVFVTSQAYGANLGGLSGADGTCQTLAQAAGLHGSYAAWLSSTAAGMSAGARLSHAAIPYHLVDGTLVANDWADLTSGSLRHAIDVTEQHGSPPGTNAGTGHDVWTDTLPSGAINFPSSTCGDSTNPGAPGSLGNYTGTATAWTYSVNLGSCAGVATLYCLEQ